ncbi:MAG: hypothetical protein IPL43_03810 [Micropruina sp.]|nr:hypothetical protein [Micropruina sp.]
MSEVIVFETPRHYRLPTLHQAEQQFEWIDVESGVVDGFYTSEGELLGVTGGDAVFIKLARSRRFAAQELADRLASTVCDGRPCCKEQLT